MINDEWNCVNKRDIFNCLVDLNRSRNRNVRNGLRLLRSSCYLIAYIYSSYLQHRWTCALCFVCLFIMILTDVKIMHFTIGYIDFLFISQDSSVNKFISNTRIDNFVIPRYKRYPAFLRVLRYPPTIQRNAVRLIGVTLMKV